MTEQETKAAAEPPPDCNVMRRVVCAAMRHPHPINGVICSPRHWDMIAREAVRRSCHHEDSWRKAEQGFIDQRGEFLTREEAWVIAEAAGQIIRRVGGDGGRLFSENLY